MKLTRAQIIIIVVVVLAAALVAFVFIRDAQTPRIPVAEPLTQTFDKSPTGFTLKYPDGWEYTIPMVGVFLLAPSETLYENQPGPTLTIQRTAPSSLTGTLENALIDYLNGAPLKTPGRWRLTDQIHAIQFQARDARVVEIEGSDTAGGTLMHSQIVATESDNSFVYLIITLVPADDQAAAQPTLDAMLATVEILE